MRITSNMLVQQLVQAAKSEGTQKPEVGAAITARISEVLNGVLTLDIGNGKQLLARDLSGQNFSTGQTVTFDVVGFDETGTMQIRLSGNETAADQQELGPLLKKLNLPDTEGNRELIRTLSGYRIPLSAANIKAAQELSVQAKGIVQLADRVGSDMIAEHEAEPLKQIAARLIEITAPLGKVISAETIQTGKPSSEQRPMPPAASTTGNQGDSKVNPAGNLSLEQDEMPIPDNLRIPAVEKNSIPKVSGNQAIAEIIKPSGISAPEIKTDSDNLPKPADQQTKVTARGEELKELLRQFTYEKIGFVIKNQLPSDLGTLNTLDKLILGKKELGVQLLDLLNNLPDDNSAAPLREAIQNAAKAVHITQDMNPFELQKQLKSLNHELTALSARVSEAGIGNTNVKESLAEVKNSLDFLGRLSESATYLHVPVTLGQGTKPMDLFVQRDKSGKKKVNPRDTRIFISLDTNHMETVQCLVEVQDKKLNVGFKLADSNVLELISRLFEPLKESLSKFGYTDVQIHGTVYQRPLNLMDITQESPLDLRRIDMRV